MDRNNKSFIELKDEFQNLITAKEANHFSIIPKDKIDGCVKFFSSEFKQSSEISIINELEMILDCKVELSFISDEIIRNSLAKYYRQSNDETLEIERLDFIDSLVTDARRLSASDIHIEIYNDRARVRMRLDGNLIETKNIELDEYLEIVNQVKIKARLNITEKRLPQDGRIEYGNIDIRVSILPTHYGEGIVMRLLGKDASNLDIEKIGFEEHDYLEYKKAISRPNGIILISGPTGSGKTTTLYATLKTLNTPNKKIVTVEDPIEYTLEGINQVQLREDIGLDFTAALKSFLRQDPDIIMLGEIRDAQTAQMAIRASLTGHLVFSTIHTNSSIGTISRLEDMGVPKFLIAETLNLSVAQRLIKILCDSCKKTIEMNLEELPNSFHQTLINEKSNQQVFEANGCDKCFFTGYQGRTALFELLPITENLRVKIKSGYMNEAESDYLNQTLSSKAFKLFIDGKTSLEEIYPLLLKN